MALPQGVKSLTAAMALVLVVTACGIDFLDSSETERLDAEVERLEAEVEDLRDRLQEGGLVEPTITLGVDPPQSDELIGFLWGEIFVMDPYGRDVRQLTDHPDDLEIVDWLLPQWSPDGSQIVYVLSGDLRVVNTDGTNDRRLLENRSCGRTGVASWSPDGKSVLFTCAGRDIYVINADGTGLRQLTRWIDDGAGGRVFNIDASWSPDGQYISYREVTSPWGKATSESIVFISFPKGQEVDRSFTFPGGGIAEGFPVTWNPQGPYGDEYPIAYTASKDGENNQIFAEYFFISSVAKGFVGTGYGPFFNQYPDSLVRRNTPAWSVDGRFAYIGKTVDGPEIFMDFSGCLGCGPQQLTNNLVRDGHPVWSPDGKRIAHTSHRDVPYGIHVMDDEGRNILSTGQSGIPWGWISTG